MSKQQTRTIGGKDYFLVVLKVLERDGQGRPIKFHCGYDDSVFQLSGDEEFITAFVYAKSCAPNVKRMQ